MSKSVSLKILEQKLHVKVNDRNTRTRCEICLKLTMKTPCSSVSIDNLEYVIASWDKSSENNKSIVL